MSIPEFDNLYDAHEAIEALRKELDEKSGAMPLELVERSRELLKQAYEAKLEALRKELKIQDEAADILTRQNDDLRKELKIQDEAADILTRQNDDLRKERDEERNKKVYWHDEYYKIEKERDAWKKLSDSQEVSLNSVLAKYKDK